jgi:L-aminopeptidase/D-esterase-like protein
VSEANDTLTAVAGLRVGHWSDSAAATGCTVVLAPEESAPASGLVLGAAPGGRETDLLAPEKTVPAVHGILLTGGSAFGLDAAAGVMRWLEARGVGFATPFARVPIVPAAVIYDLGVGRADVRPDAAAGAAAADAAHAGPVEMGRVGVGAGASVGKVRGPDRAVPSGVGSAAMRVGGVTVAALAVSNAVGALVDPSDGRAVAGEVVSAQEIADRVVSAGTNTSLVVVATDARLDKAGCRALAPAGHVGVAQVTRPSHTAHDGDTVFVLATGRNEARSPAALGPAVQEVVARALLRGARAAADAA